MGEDQAILAARQALYVSARDLNPARWSRGNTKLDAARGRDTASRTRLRRDDKLIQPLAA